MGQKGDAGRAIPARRHDGAGDARAWAVVQVFAALCCALAGLGWTTEVTPAPKLSAATSSRPLAPTKSPPINPAAIPGAAAVAATEPGASDPSAGAGVAVPSRRPDPQRLAKIPGGAVALAAALEVDATGTALVLTLTRSARFATFTLADPYRVVIDLQAVDFKIPQTAGTTAGTTGRGLVKSFRYGLLAPGKSRVVVDLVEPAQIEKAAIVALRGADTVQLRLVLVPTTRDQFVAGALANPVPPAAATAAANPPLTASASAGGPPVASDPAPALPKRPKGPRPVIVLDPGHGGLDAGTLGSAAFAEKDVVLRFAKLLRDRLRATGRFEVHLTREIDIFVRLDDRVRMARDRHCDLFISLHTDSVPAQYAHLNVRGATVYTVGEQTGDARAQQLAEKENLSDVIAGVEGHHDEPPEVATILTDLMRRETANSSQAFTTSLLGQMRKTTGLSREPHRHANFKVLRAPDFPSVLIELGFLSNKEDEKLLVAKAWQEQTAGAVTQAVEAYFSKRVARTPF